MRIKAILASCLLLVATGCGGGGGGDGGGNNGPRGSFTLSATSASIMTKRFRTGPTATVQLRLQDDAAKFVGAAYVSPQVPPQWLEVTIVGSAPDYTVNFRASDTSVPAGEYSAVVTLGTADASQNVLQTRTVTVNYSLRTPIASPSQSIAGIFVLGHSTASSTASLPVTADSRTQWRASSAVPWIQVPASTGTGDGQTSYTLDSSTLGTGTHTGAVVITDVADPGDRTTVPVVVTVAPPAFSLSAGSALIGGADGLGNDGEALQLTLATGQNVHAFSASVSTNDGAPWLSVSPASADVAEIGTTVTLNADRAAVPPGTYSGNVALTVVVRGESFTRSIPVTFNEEGHWLLVPTPGVALSQFPSRSTLSRSISVISTRGRTYVPWTAQSDRPWLDVTPAGTTGSALELTVDPAGLADDQLHLATVAVASGAPDILNQETVRVGFWKGSTDPVRARVSAATTQLIANPVEPVIYAHDGTSTIRVYNVYSGALVATLGVTASEPSTMVTSSDGRVLYMMDEATLEIVAVHPASGTEIRRYPYSPFDATGFTYARPNAQPVLLAANGTAFEAESGRRFVGRFTTQGGGSFGMAAHPTGRSFVAYPTDRAAGAARYTLNYSLLTSDRFVSESAAGGVPDPIDVCASPDGTRIFSVARSHDFYIQDAHTMQLLNVLPSGSFGSSVDCGWNGLLVGGLRDAGVLENVWPYRSDGTPLARFELDPGESPNIVASTLVLSGDNTRLIGATNAGVIVFRDAPAP